jgi:hypothetical protein
LLSTYAFVHRSAPKVSPPSFFPLLEALQDAFSDVVFPARPRWPPQHTFLAKIINLFHGSVESRHCTHLSSHLFQNQRELGWSSLWNVRYSTYFVSHHFLKIDACYILARAAPVWVCVAEVPELAT